jgi:cholesterol oxidase
MGAPRPEHDADVLVIGSGFGGSVAALRPSEKGYRVTVLEAGLRFTDDTLPRTSWDVRRFLWAPAWGSRGSSGSARSARWSSSPAPFFRDRQCSHITD